MGDPKKTRKKYDTPSHPWQRERINEEKDLVKEFGLKNKKEIWRADSLLRQFKRQTKRLIRERSVQAEKEKKLMFNKLYRLGLISTPEAQLEDILGLDVKDVLERRLQTQVLRKKLANTVKQARQFIVHGHVFVKSGKISIPSYIVLRDEEDSISFNPSSNLSDTEHPMRAKEKPEVKTELKIKKKEEAKGKKKEEPKEEEPTEEEEIEDIEEEEVSEDE